MKRKIENPQGRQGSSGMSFVEVLTAVALVAVLVTAAHAMYRGIVKTGQDIEFYAQVRELNEAIDVYRANGGDLSGLNGEEVIAKLKTVADPTSARKINGLKGRFVELGLIGVLQTAAEAASDERRAIWMPAAVRFEVVESGEAGFNRFTLDGESEVVEEERVANLELSSKSRWVWDYRDRDSAGTSYAPPSIQIPRAPTPPEGEEEPKMLTLFPPEFSIPGGEYPYTEFDLPLAFSNPNPFGVSEIFYSINAAEWRIYDGSLIMVDPDDSVMAYAVATDPDTWLDSAIGEETYESTFVISGAAAGLFDDAVGGPDMVTGGWGNYFTWGTPAEGFTDPSWLLFEGASFVDVSPDERFLLGSVNYHNGTIVSGSGATGLDLNIELVFAGGDEDEEFEFDLNLINTPNLPENTQEESADYVQFGEIYAEVPAVLGGVEYNLVLEFGETSENGFSTIDEFFVFEGESASGQLWGTLTRAWGEG